MEHPPGLLAVRLHLSTLDAEAGESVTVSLENPTDQTVFATLPGGDWVEVPPAYSETLGDHVLALPAEAEGLDQALVPVVVAVAEAPLDDPDDAPHHVATSVQVRADALSFQVSPGGSGRVLGYRVQVGAQRLSQLVYVTGDKASPLRDHTGYWPWMPGSSDTAFSLTPTGEITTGAAASRVGSTRLTNPTFERKAQDLKPPSGWHASWAIYVDGQPLGWLARTGDALHWYSTKALRWLPARTLTFRKAKLPVGRAVYTAVDRPV